MEDFNLIQFIMGLFGASDATASTPAGIWNIVAQIVGLATAITVWLKSSSDNPAWSIILKVLKYLSGNVLNNANVDDLDA